ncbi:hypothetical protein SISSUDRAFT_1128413 [Sistotremastrum suecicum HHB10207 ss-3]|uniref:WW domain-containing protein n=1 Tax=Sistotremastrum suecicum HHB10207 ss-3 TaxID=1314776 RepID=A0A166DVE7_9AGAM|nr:hypothetical protein SISSUDRAFT_1128413 [Sistotremastrum suecicum HHB10207 ss-3]
MAARMDNRPLPAGWTSHYDPPSKHWYYRNGHHSSWVHPADFLQNQAAASTNAEGSSSGGLSRAQLLYKSSLSQSTVPILPSPQVSHSPSPAPVSGQSTPRVVSSQTSSPLYSDTLSNPTQIRNTSSSPRPSRHESAPSPRYQATETTPAASANYATIPVESEQPKAPRILHTVAARPASVIEPPHPATTIPSAPPYHAASPPLEHQANHPSYSEKPQVQPSQPSYVVNQTPRAPEPPSHPNVGPPAAVPGSPSSQPPLKLNDQGQYGTVPPPLPQRQAQSPNRQSIVPSPNQPMPIAVQQSPMPPPIQHPPRPAPVHSQSQPIMQPPSSYPNMPAPSTNGPSDYPSPQQSNITPNGASYPTPYPPQAQYPTSPPPPVPQNAVPPTPPLSPDSYFQTSPSPASGQFHSVPTTPYQGTQLPPPPQQQNHPRRQSAPPAFHNPPPGPVQAPIQVQRQAPQKHGFGRFGKALAGLAVGATIGIIAEGAIENMTGNQGDGSTFDMSGMGDAISNLIPGGGDSGTPDTTGFDSSTFDTSGTDFSSFGNQDPSAYSPDNTFNTDQGFNGGYDPTSIGGDQGYTPDTYGNTDPSMGGYDPSQGNGYVPTDYGPTDYGSGYTPTTYGPSGSNPDLSQYNTDPTDNGGNDFNNDQSQGQDSSQSASGFFSHATHHRPNHHRGGASFVSTAQKIYTQYQHHAHQQNPAQNHHPQPSQPVGHHPYTATVQQPYTGNAGYPAQAPTQPQYPAYGPPPQQGHHVGYNQQPQGHHVGYAPQPQGNRGGYNQQAQGNAHRGSSAIKTGKALLAGAKIMGALLK